MAIPNKGIKNFLYARDFFVRERGASVRFYRLLHIGAVLNGLRLVRGEVAGFLDWCVGT